MGQQQLLLILLGIVIIGIAIVVGINLYRSSAIDTKRDAVMNDLVTLSTLAQQYYMRPTGLGGGARTFTGWTIPPQLVTTVNGHYSATVAVQQVDIIGTGNEVVTGVDSVKVSITVRPTSFQTTIIN